MEFSDTKYKATDKIGLYLPDVVQCKSISDFHFSGNHRLQLYLNQQTMTWFCTSTQGCAKHFEIYLL